MKTLKLNHELAELVRSGQKASTIRLYDDKDISVDDEVQFIDKVDPHNRGTWVPIGTGHVTTIVQKRLGEINSADLDGHEKYDSNEQMVEAFRGYYGFAVNEQTPVK